MIRCCDFTLVLIRTLRLHIFFSSYWNEWRYRCDCLIISKASKIGWHVPIQFFRLPKSSNFFQVAPILHELSPSYDGGGESNLRASNLLFHVRRRYGMTFINICNYVCKFWYNFRIILSLKHLLFRLPIHRANAIPASTILLTRLKYFRLYSKNFFFLYLLDLKNDVYFNILKSMRVVLYSLYHMLLPNAFESFFFLFISVQISKNKERWRYLIK